MTPELEREYLEKQLGLVNAKYCIEKDRIREKLFKLYDKMHENRIPINSIYAIEWGFLRLSNDT